MDWTLKADRLLQEIETAENLAKKVAAADDRLIPVMIKGVQVGIGRLHKDGSFSAEVFGGPEGRELRDRFPIGSEIYAFIGPRPTKPTPPSNSR